MGLRGLCMAIDMIKHGCGRNFVIVEKGSQVGGTWHDNCYPGSSCGMIYRFFFSLREARYDCSSQSQ